MYSGSPNAHVSGHQFDIGQATLQRDRFAALEAGSSPGNLVTKTMEYRAGRLFVNAEIAADGYVRVGLVDSNGSSVPGYEHEISHTASGDSLRERVWWDGQAYLPKGAPAGTRFEFTMKNASLYSFWVEPLAPVTSIDLVNANFDHDQLPGNNQYNFAGAYAGWTEVNPSTGVANQVFNVGPINLPSSDLTAEHGSAANVLYFQESPAQVRVDQTTQHVISADDYQFDLSALVGNDLLPGRFGGYGLSLYADDGSTKSILKTISGTDVNDDELVEQTLTLTDDLDVDLAPFIGQHLGVAISSAGETYLNPLGNSVPGIVFYDSVKLFAIGAPQFDEGDYNGNGVVDSADYLLWRKTLGQTGTGLVADGNGDGMVDDEDLDVWKRHFGRTASDTAPSAGGGGAAQHGEVPEPSGILIWIFLACKMAWLRFGRESADERASTQLAIGN